MNDFVALLVAVMAFLLTLILGEAALLALHDAAGNETLLALGPPLRLLVSFGTGCFVYRKLLRERATPPAAAIFTKA